MSFELTDSVSQGSTDSDSTVEFVSSNTSATTSTELRNSMFVGLSEKSEELRRNIIEFARQPIWILIAYVSTYAIQGPHTRSEIKSSVEQGDFIHGVDAEQVNLNLEWTMRIHDLDPPAMEAIKCLLIAAVLAFASDECKNQVWKNHIPNRDAWVEMLEQQREWMQRPAWCEEALTYARRRRAEELIVQRITKFQKLKKRIRKGVPRHRNKLKQAVWKVGSLSKSIDASVLGYFDKVIAIHLARLQRERNPRRRVITPAQIRVIKD